MTNGFLPWTFGVRQKLSELGLLNFWECKRSIRQHIYHQNAHSFREQEMGKHPTNCLVMNLEILALPNLLGEREVGGAFRTWVGVGSSGWPKPETHLGRDCLALYRCFPFFWDRCLFSLILNEYNWTLAHIVNWRVEQDQDKGEIQTQLTFSALASFFCTVFSPLLTAPHPSQSLPSSSSISVSKIWH